MADDLARFLDSRDIDKVTLIGHNIGGKTAMCFAGLYPEKLRGLISLDTAPVKIDDDKAKSTKDIIERIMSINIDGKGKKSALAEIESKFPDKGIANMISNNLAYTEEDNHSTVKWCVNLKAIHNNI